MTDEDVDTDRAVVKTYVPQYQKDRWRAEADDLDMSQSEFVRSMVQAGRRDFDFGPERADSPEAGPDPTNPRGDDLERRLLDVLEVDRFSTWDELVELLAGDFEERLEEAVRSLSAEGRVVHSPRRGGYALAEGPDE